MGGQRNDAAANASAAFVSWTICQLDDFEADPPCPLAWVLSVPA